jgi:RNA-binding protein
MDRPSAQEPTAPVATPLTGSDRRHLRRLAHTLDPVVQIGAAGVTPGVLSALDGALRDHELVKVRITRGRDERSEIAAAIAEETRSAVAGLVGHVAVLYRPAPDPDRRRIELPSARRRSFDRREGRRSL